MASNTRARPSHTLSTAAGENPLPPVGIAVLGVTGSGKSSFINTASNSVLRVGDDLQSCTAEVELSDEFILDGRRVFLMDTPGFDDTNISDAEILKRIAAFLAVTYEKGSKLAGIIYIHRISDVRFTGASTRNFRMFRKLCGEEAMKNVIFVTNMWGTLGRQVEEHHEKQLINTHFKPALSQGAQTARHYHTTQSAHEIISRIIKNDPTTLLIQKELVDEHKGIEKTSAGETVNEELNKALARHKAEMEELREEMRRALAEKDEQAAREMKEEVDKLKQQMDKVREAGAGMAVKYEEERKAVEEKMDNVMEEMRLRDLEEKKRMEEMRVERAAMVAKYEEERKAAEKAMEDKVQEMRRDLERRKQMEDMRAERAAMAAKYEEDRKAAGRALEDTIQRMKEHNIEERRKAHEEHVKRINELNTRFVKPLPPVDSGLATIARGFKILCKDTFNRRKAGSRS